MALVWMIIASVGLIQGSFLISSLQSLFAKQKTRSLVQKWLGILQVVPILTMLASEIAFFFLIYLPAEVAKPFSSFEGLLYIVIACYLWLNVVFNYLAALIICPGYPETQEELEEDGLLDGDVQDFCVKCDRIRDKGTHHCSTCNTCVQMMSHHCPLTNNCVGLNNFAYFYLFLLYCSLGLVFAAYLTYRPFRACMMGPADVSYLLNNGHGYTAGKCKDLGEYAVMFIPVSFMLVFMTLLLTFHTFLLILDMALIDFLRAFQNTQSLGRFLVLLLSEVCQRPKLRFRKLIFCRRENWWKFIVPSFNEIPELLPPDSFLV